MKPNDPTAAITAALQRAFDFFNARLFERRLTPCVIRVQRGARALGYYGPRHWQWSDGADERPIGEIALGAEHISDCDVADVLSTLAHEMAHHYQELFGRPSRSGHHNREWGALMRAIGLMPSSTGAPGGRETGRAMSHYIEPGGAFDVACAELLEDGFDLPLVNCVASMCPSASARRASKTKYECPSCGSAVWGRPGMAITCSGCGVAFVEISAQK